MFLNNREESIILLIKRNIQIKIDLINCWEFNGEFWKIFLNKTINHPTVPFCDSYAGHKRLLTNVSSPQRTYLAFMHNATHDNTRNNNEPYIYIHMNQNQLHAVSRTELTVKTFRSPFSAELWRHCVLSGGSQRRTLPRHQSEENENI